MQGCSCYEEPLRRAPHRQPPTRAKSASSSRMSRPPPTIAPTWRRSRARAANWGARDLAVLWVSMAACIPTYMVGVLAHRPRHGLAPSCRHHLSRQLYCACADPLETRTPARATESRFQSTARAAFGIRGANLPALMRALVACGWFRHPDVDWGQGAAHAVERVVSGLE